MKSFAIASAVGLVSSALASPLHETRSLHFKTLEGITSDSIHNIHIEYVNKDFVGDLHMVYGDCNLKESHESHHTVGRTEITLRERSDRFVWIVPADASSGDCLHAFSGSRLVGRSAPIDISSKVKRRQVISDVADSSGPWFDGVAYMKGKNNTGSFVAAAKDKSKRTLGDSHSSMLTDIEIAILGGGMAGLMTSLLLQSVGIEGWEIMESSQRVGGYVPDHLVAYDHS